MALSDYIHPGESNEVSFGLENEKLIKKKPLVLESHNFLQQIKKLLVQGVDSSFL